MPANDHAELDRILEGLNERFPDYVVTYRRRRNSCHEQVVREVWAYYIQQIGMNPHICTLTEKRMRMGINRLLECQKKVLNEEIDRAKGLMMLAIDTLRNSKWHNGKEPGHPKKFLDWEIIFGSTEQLEKWFMRAPQ